MTDLPRWELNDRFGFASPMDESLDNYIAETGDQAKVFHETYEGKLAEPATSLRKVIVEYEQIAVRRGTVSSYLALHYDTQLDNDALKKRKGAIGAIQSQVFGDHLEWFSLDLAAMDDAILAGHYEKDAALQDYKSYIDEERRFKDHNLSKDVERALTMRNPWMGIGTVVSFFDKERSLMRFTIKDGDEPVNMEVLLSILGSSKDADLRAKCLQELNKGLGENVGRIAALSLSNVAGAWHIENQERKYTNLRTQRNLGNNCPDAVVDSLLLGVRNAGVPLCQRFYHLKRGILKQTQGLEKFRWSDRNAPIDIDGGGSKEDDKISWEECVKIVEKGYRSFSPRMADMFTGFVKEKRIDVPATDGKQGGAYCSGAVPGIGPFQLLNYDGTKRDVATTAHESGHAVHNVLAYPKGYLQYHPPLTLAETASIFGETIVFRDLLKMATSPHERLSLLMSKIDDTINSVVRQCSFDRFEELAHTARKEGELNVEELDKYWMQAVEEYYGKAGVEGAPFDDYDDIEHLWAYVPHFHHVPFYVYSYAFADLVVGTLYHSFQTTPDGFEDRLLDLLAAGGTLDFATALAPFGLDPKSPSFWEDAIKAHLGGLLEEAESLAIELGYLKN